MSEPTPAVEPCDEIREDNARVGYRVILDLNHEDADLIDRVAHDEGIQPTQILLQALRAYARRDEVRSAQVRAIGRFGVALRRAA